MLVTLLAVSAAMAVSDVLGTLMVVAEAKGRPWLAGLLDALGDVSRVIYMALGVDAITHGFTTRAVATLAAICASSFFATSLTTRWARHHVKEATP